MLSMIPALGPSLKVLDLSSCVALTNQTMQAICTHLSHLSVLRLAWCKELQDWGLLGLKEPSDEPVPNPQVLILNVREGEVTLVTLAQAALLCVLNLWQNFRRT